MKMADLKPDVDAVRRHLEFMTSGMEDYKDGKIQICLLNKAKMFGFDQIDAAIEQVETYNKIDNVYTCGSIMLPSAPYDGRCNMANFYATNVLWCDIDNNALPYMTAETLKKKYSALPPNRIVVTGRAPSLRCHLWWKLSEPLTDPETIAEALKGVQQALEGDSKVAHAVALMRVAGGVSFASEKKKAKGYTDGLVEWHNKHDVPCTIEGFMRAYPQKEGSKNHNDKQQITTTNGIMTYIEDGRELYMSDMVYATICNLKNKLYRWPTPTEVYDDAWPLYSRKITSKNGRTLDQDNRGSKMMQQKILSKLRLFRAGKMPEIKSPPTTEKNTQNEHVDPETGEGSQKPSCMTYLKYVDCKPPLKSNDFVQGLFGNNQMSVTYGESNCGKTFFKTDLSFHVAMGQKWREKRVEGGGVIYAALEGSYGLMNRMEAFKLHTGVKDMPFAMVSTQLDFMNPKGNITEFIDLINRAADDLGSVKLIVIDTLARALTGGDENSGKDMGMLVTHADKIRYATNAHVNFIHHSGKDLARGARGHSSLRAAVDTEIEISREKDAEYSLMKVVKQREMELGEDMAFSLKRIVLGINQYNEEISSCVVVPFQLEGIPDRRKHLKPKTKNALDVLNNVIIEKGFIALGSNFPSGVRIVTEENFEAELKKRGMISEERKTCGVQFRRIIKDLLDNDVIRIYDKKIWVCFS